MKLSSLNSDLDKRVAFVPNTVKKLVQLGFSVVLEHNYASHLYEIDDYVQAGATFGSAQDCLQSDCLIQVCFDQTLLKQVPASCMVLGLIKPFERVSLLSALAKKQQTIISMEFVPRSTRAQKMDVLSSQASLAGYVAVTMATERLNKVLPMMMTPAGTLAPAKVFVIGAGVAGLQAIATAKRLGANVIAFDTRPVAQEQVESLGANFLTIDLGKTDQTDQGYATQLTAKQLQLQQAAMAKVCAQSDIVITTAQVFGRKAPIIVTKDMLAAMKPGSVIVDCAASTGGNVEGIELNKELQRDKVTLIGLHDLAQYVPKHASEMYAANVAYFLEEFFDQEKKSFDLNLEDDIIKSMLTTYKGNLVQPMLVKQLNEQQGG